MNILTGNKKTKEKVWFEEGNKTFFAVCGEQKEYVLGFTLEILQTICAGSSGQGGWCCTLRHMNHSDRRFPCFVSTTSLHKESQFLTELSGSDGMPPIDATNMTTKLLSSYFKWKNEQFVKFCRQHNLTFDKIPVECRNLQKDGKTFAFGPDLFFERRNGIVERIRPEDSSYVWVPSKLGNLTPLRIALVSTGPNILEVVRQKLEKDNMPEKFICFLLVAGQITVLSLHYKEILEMFNLNPGLVVTGPRGTGKSLSTDSGLSFLGQNALEICGSKDVTLASLRDRYADDHFPLVVHDLPDHNTAATAIQETFEGKPIKKHDKHVRPGCSITITCNESQMDYLQGRYEALSRAVVIPLDTQMLPKTTEELQEIQRALNESSAHFASLVNFTDEDKEYMRTRTVALREKFVKVKSPTIQDSKHRIIENYAIVTAATEIFLQKINFHEWIPKIEPYVSAVILPRAAPYYTFRETPAMVRIASQTAPVPAKTKDEMIMELCKSIGAVRAKFELELSGCFKVMINGEYVCIREKEYLPLLAKTDHPICNLADLFVVTASVYLNPQKFPPHPGSKRCRGISKSHFSMNQLQFICGEADELEEVDVDVQAAVPGTTMPSPFKRHSRRDDSLRPSTSTQIEGDQAPFNRNDRTISPIGSASASGAADEMGNNILSASTSRDPPVPITGKNIHNISIRRMNEMPVLPEGQRSEPITQPVKRVKVAEILCDECGKQAHDDDLGKTVPCTKCKKRFHIPCQVQHEKDWPNRENAKGRVCDTCRQSVPS